MSIAKEKRHSDGILRSLVTQGCREPDTEIGSGLSDGLAQLALFELLF